MTYDEALNFILKKQSLGIKPGLTRILSLLDKMDNPQDKIKIIHIAGTNGKGTIAATIANSLVKNGYNIGLFSSPWVENYREQIKYNNEFISCDDFAFYVDKYKDNDCTEFEFLTAIMYKYFADKKVDYAVVECGMGGKGDSTNVEKENISVITSIALDHTSFLGNTVEEIAREKAGILRKNSPCVLYPNKGLEYIFEPLCSDLVKVQDKGNFSLNNLETAKEVLNLLGIKDNIELAKLPARQEIINGVMLDSAHNVDGAKALQLNLPKGDITAVIGMMRDKDIDGYLSVIAPNIKKIITTCPSNQRSISALKLKEMAEKYCTNVIAIDNPASAIDYAKNDANFKLVCGSFYLSRDIRKLL